MGLKIAYNIFSKLIPKLNEKLEVKILESSDWYRISESYMKAIEKGSSKFDFPIWEQWEDHSRPNFRWMLMNEKNVLLGWASMFQPSLCPSHLGIIQISVYLDNPKYWKKGGGMLIENIINTGIENDFWVLQVKVIKENKKAINLYLSNDFRYVGVLEKHEKISGQWKDMILLEKRIENLNSL